MNGLLCLLAGGLIATTSTLTTADPGGSIVPDDNALSHEHVPNALFLRFKVDLPELAREDLLGQVGGTIRQSFWLVPGLVSIDTKLPVADALSVLTQRDDALLYVEPIYIVHTFDTTPNDPSYGDLYGMPQIRANLAWDDHTGDQDFVICVIDTGVDYNHQDLVSNVWTNPGEIAGNSQDDDGNGYVDDIHGYDFYNNDSDPYDDNSHGTHCSGTIGGQGNNNIGVVGVNWNCRIAGAKFLSGGGTGTIEGAIGAVQYCAANQFKVSSNSWGGGGFSQSLYDGIQNAGTQFGHVFVAAAGNGGSYGASYPASYDCFNIISVAASDSNENMASFTQYHPVEVDLAAPGVDVLSSVPGDGYDYFSGTSMATPHVSGGVAMVYSLMSNATAEQIIDIILSTARPASAWSGQTATGGILNVDAALDAMFLAPQFSLQSDLPIAINPDTPLVVTALLDPRDDVVVAGSVQLRHRIAGLETWATIDMKHLGDGVWTATIPGLQCSVDAGLVLSCEGESSGIVTYPTEGIQAPMTWFIGTRMNSWSDDGESDGGWTVDTEAADGHWSRGIPVNCGQGDPPFDFDGSGGCWLTDNDQDSCDSDVDNGWTRLMSAPLDVGALQQPFLSYARWFSNSTGSAPGTDTLTVQISADNGAWTVLETVGPTGPHCDGGWVEVAWDLDLVAPAAQTIRIRFTVSDIGEKTQSTVEAAIDAIRVIATECVDPIWGACCVEESCLDAMNESQCASLGGIFHPNTPCNTVACGGEVEGACCVGDSCVVLSVNACAEAQGVFQDESSTCDEVYCDDGIDLPMVTVAVGRDLVTSTLGTWTTDLYVVVGQGARIDVIAGTGVQAKVLSSSGDFYQDPYGGPTSAHINPAFYSEEPDLEWDSRITIGALDVTGTPFGDNALQSVGIDWTSFESGGSLVVNDGAWFVLPTDEQGQTQWIMADDCSMVHAVRVARLTMLDQSDTVYFESWVQGRNSDNVVFDDPARIEAAFVAVEDCNVNGISDTCDIAYGSSMDLDDNGVPDECQGVCPGDANGDGFSDIDDILTVISMFETTDADADVDDSGFVDIDDLLQVIGFFNSC